MKTTKSLRLYQVFAASLTLVCAGAALAAPEAPADDAQARYPKELAECNSPTSKQDPAACRLEAKRALAESRRGSTSSNTKDYQKNLLRRCEVHQGAARTECEARMRDGNIVQGSVYGGGVLRQNITAPAPAKPASQ